MPTPIAPLCLLTCESGRSFAEEVALHLGQAIVPTSESWFACGEGKLIIERNIRGCDAYVFQSCVGSQDDLSVYDRFLMLLHAVEAAKHGHGEHDALVLRRAVWAAQQVGNLPDQVRKVTVIGHFSALVCLPTHARSESCSGSLSYLPRERTHSSTSDNLNFQSRPILWAGSPLFSIHR